MNTYHITVVYKTREYFRVEANNEEEAKTGIKVINVLKSKRLWVSIVDALAILGIATVLILTVVVTVPVMFVYLAVVGAIILWEER